MSESRMMVPSAGATRKGQETWSVNGNQVIVDMSNKFWCDSGDTKDGGTLYNSLKLGERILNGLLTKKGPRLE